MVCLNRPYQLRFFKGCIPKILLGPFLNTLSQVFHRKIALNIFIRLPEKQVHLFRKIDGFQQQLHKKWYSVGKFSINFQNSFLKSSM